VVSLPFKAYQIALIDLSSLSLVYLSPHRLTESKGRHNDCSTISNCYCANNGHKMSYGSVKIQEDVNFNVPIVEKILVRFLGNLEHPRAQALLDMQKKGQSVVLEISPKYYSTWNYSKQ
jgi:hypothetical protein